ncbi:MAG: ATP-binding protein [Candidatus Hodarchaeales archaeon]
MSTESTKYHHYINNSYQQILDAALDAVFIIQGSKYVYTNKQAAKLLGYNNPSEVIGKNMLDHTDKAYHSLVKNRARARQRGEKVLSLYEITLVNRNGEKIPVEVNVSYIYYQGKPSSLSFVRDKRDKKKYYERLQAIHTFTERISRAANIDEIEQITYEAINTVLEHNRGSLGLVKGENLVHQYRWNMNPENPFVMPLDGPGVTVRTVNTGKTQLVEDVLNESSYVNGDIYDNSTRSELAVPIILENKVYGVINLEKRVVNGFSESDVRILEIVTSYIAAALYRFEQKEELELAYKKNNLELIEGFKWFSRMIRHDLKNPLMTINNSIYLIENNPDKVFKYLDLIKKSVKLHETIMDDWSKKLHNKNVKRKNTMIKELVENCISSVNIPDNIRVELDVDDNIAFSVDRTCILRVLMNLLNNSIEAMPNGGKIKVSVNLSDALLHIVVSDTGIGISKDSIDRIFTPFFTSKEYGSGLGLAYCRQAIEAHNGTITFSSTQKIGTTFKIIIPDN